MRTNYEDEDISGSRALSYVYSHLCHGGSLVCESCDCGLTHFTTAPGHGTYDEGELEKYQSDPKCIEWTNFDTIHHVEFGGHWVVGCRCGKAEMLGEILMDNIDGLTDFVKGYWDDSKKNAERKLETAKHNINKLA